MNSEVQELDVPARFTPAGEAPSNPSAVAAMSIGAWAKVTPYVSTAACDSWSAEEMREVMPRTASFRLV
jgi:hypothetical protein